MKRERKACRLTYIIYQRFQGRVQESQYSFEMSHKNVEEWGRRIPKNLKEKMVFWKDKNDREVKIRGIL